jgi:hypothetical protein
MFFTILTSFLLPFIGMVVGLFLVFGVCTWILMRLLRFSNSVEYYLEILNSSSKHLLPFDGHTGTCHNARIAARHLVNSMTLIDYKACIEAYSLWLEQNLIEFEIRKRLISLFSEELNTLLKNK